MVYGHILKMSRKGGTVFLLLMCCTVLVTSLKISPEITDEARRQMKKCKDKGYDQLDKDELNSMGSDVTLEREPGSPTSIMSVIKNIWDSVSEDPTVGPKQREEKSSRVVKQSTVPDMIKKMKTASNTSKCAMSAVIGPISWMVINSEETANMDSTEFEDYVFAINEGAETLPRQLPLPKTIAMKHVEILMNMLKNKYPSTSKQQIMQVVKWAKKQIMKNCTKTASKPGECLKWVTRSTMMMLGPYMSSLSPDEIQRIQPEVLCDFFNSDKSRQIKAFTKRLNPSVGKMIVHKIKNCTTLRTSLDRLGKLACYYDPPALTSDQKIKLLSQISECPGQAKRKKSLMQSVTKNNVAEVILKLGNATRFLSKKQLAQLSKDEVETVLNNTSSSTINFRKQQMLVLVKKYLGNTMQCRELSKKELRVVLPVLKALPNCFLKKTFNKEPRNSEEFKYMLKHVPQKIAKSQAVTIGKEAFEKQNATEVIDSLSDEIVQAIPLDTLKNNKESLPLKKLTRVKWSRPQASQFVKFMKKGLKTEMKKIVRDLGTLTPGITCKMIESIGDGDVQEMVRGLADARLSKVQAICAARKLFKTLKKEKPSFPQKITTEELRRIPPEFLIHTPPKMIESLPGKMCQEFLQMMSTVDLSSLPEQSPSRTALMERALKCLSGKDLSNVSSEDMAQLGPLSCVVPPKKLRTLRVEVQRSVLQDLGSCDFIPENHIDGLLQLLTDIFGNPRNWNDVIIEKMGFLLLLKKTSSPALPEEPWMKDAIPILLQRLPKPLQNFHKAFLKKLLFKLIVSEYESESQVPARRKRDAKPSIVVPTPELITDLAEENNNWTPEQLMAMSSDTFLSTVEILGTVTNYSPKQLEILCNKTVEAWGSAQNMNESVVAQLGCIAQCFTKDELMKMAFSQSSLADIASCQWTQMQISAVWKGAAKYNSLSAKSLDFSDMVELDRFICGLDSAEIEQLNAPAFRDAVGSINTVGCSAQVLELFNQLTVNAFGSLSSWTEVEVDWAGIFAATLDLQHFSVDVFSYFIPEAIPYISSTKLAGLSLEQLEAFGPVNAAELTEEQKAGLSVEQRQALLRAIEGSRELTVSGTAQSAERMSTSLKLLVSFLVGLMLL